jgi:lipopolysaccharide transport system ATP-binding protein
MSIVVRVEDLWKQYRLGVIGQGALYRDVQSWWALMRGKPDPNIKIAPGVSQKSVSGDKIWALKKVSFQISEGELIGIIGKNGAGKSTLLKIISRVTAPTKGSIKIRGRVASLLEVGTGFHPELTGRENIYLNGAILGMTKSEINRKIDEIIHFSGIELYIDTPIKRYSSGMNVRLAFAVAAHLEADIMVIDEVLAVGDAEFQRKCLGKMNDVKNQGRTLLFVSHNMGMINQLCSKSIWISDGQVKDFGPSPEIVTAFLNRESGLKTGATSIFKADTSKECQALAVWLRNNNGVVSKEFSCDEPIFLDLLLQINRKIPGLYGYMQLAKVDGSVALVSDSLDISPNALDGLSEGKHRVRVTIPERTIGAGEYTVYLSLASIFGHSVTVDAPGTVARFMISDHQTPRGNNRGGYFSMCLTWKVDSSDSLEEDK